MVTFLKRNIQLIIIFLIAIGLRTIHLGTIPNGFHVDELDAGYIGRYIWTHGKDILGNYLPFVYNKFGDYRPTGIFYLSGLSALIFGSTEFAVRFPAALIGGITVVAIYFLALEFFSNKSIALFSAILLAVMPWHLVLSRATSEGIIGLFFVILGLGLLMKSYRTNSPRMMIVAGLSLIASYLFYHPFRILVPLCLLPLLFTPGRHKHIKLASIILFCLASFFTLLTVFTVAGNGRLNQVAFYQNPDLATLTQDLIAGEGPNNVLEARIFHNKIVAFTQEFVKQYSSYFSTEFLIQTGGLPKRYAVPQEGLIYVSFFVLFIIGLLTIISYKVKWKSLYILYLLVIAPLPAAVTYEDTPNIHRAVFLILPIILLTAYGLYRLLDLVKSKTKNYIFLLIIVLCIISVETINFWHYYTIFAPSSESYSRDDGLAQLVQLAYAEKGKYKYIYLPGYENLPLYYLFYTSDYQNIHFRNNPNDVLLDKIDNVIFVPDWCSTRYLRWKNLLAPSTLIIDRDDCEGFTGIGKIGEIDRKDLTKAFKLLRFIPEEYHK
ncbi:MAG TPA: glycosyltransferase family 39 protein [Patescibacteria group bacterium]|nr:glycosyltransferase family 39 protein [Patescibacteria group bacterium]